jgi:hypothetical protein
MLTMALLASKKGIPQNVEEVPSEGSTLAYREMDRLGVCEHHSSSDE